MTGEPKRMDSFPSAEPAKVDPIKVSEAYYERGRRLFEAGSWLDSLIDFRLAEAHLIGDFSPRHPPLDPEYVPLRRTLPKISMDQNHARIKLHDMGPGKQSEARYQRPA